MSLIYGKNPVVEAINSGKTINKIYVAKYWSKSPDKYYENYLYEYLLPLPIDQRYDLDDMTKIIEVINEQN